MNKETISLVPFRKAIFVVTLALLIPLVAIGIATKVGILILAGLLVAVMRDGERLPEATFGMLYPFTELLMFSFMSVLWKSPSYILLSIALWGAWIVYVKNNNHKAGERITLQSLCLTISSTAIMCYSYAPLVLLCFGIQRQIGNAFGNRQTIADSILLSLGWICFLQPLLSFLAYVLQLTEVISEYIKTRTEPLREVTAAAMKTLFLVLMFIALLNVSWLHQNTRATKVDQRSIQQWIADEPSDLYTPRTGVLYFQDAILTVAKYCYSPFINLEEAQEFVKNDFEPARWYPDYSDEMLNLDSAMIARQDITVSEANNIASVEVHEQYQFKYLTMQGIEIHYIFSLPEHAVLTGVYLGESGQKQHDFIVSTKRAASKVYLSQIPKRVDPALLERIGTNTYQLRVFPVIQNSSVWFSFNVMATKNNGTLQYDMPILKRYGTNVNKKHQFPRFINGKQVGMFDARHEWLPRSLPSQSTELAPVETYIELSRQNKLCKVSALPLTATSMAKKKLAVLFDTSYSTRDVKDEMINSLRQMEKLQNYYDVEVFYPVSHEDYHKQGDKILSEPLNKALQRVQGNYPDTKGGYFVHDMICQYQRQEAAAELFDGVLILADMTNHHLSSPWFTYPELCNVLDLKTPLFMLYANSTPDAHLQSAQSHLIQLRTQIASTNADEIIDRLIQLHPLPWSAIVKGQHQITFDCSRANSAPQQAPFQALAAKFLIQHALSHQDKDNFFNLEHSTDPMMIANVHTLSKKYKIVADYSSMIVLVNDEQKQQLKAEEALDAIHPTRRLFGSAASRGSPDIFLLLLLVIAAFVLLCDFSI